MKLSTAIINHSTPLILIGILFLFLLITEFYSEISVIWFRFFYDKNEKKLIYKVLFKTLRTYNKKGKYSSKYLLESFFNNELKIPRNISFISNTGLAFWETVYRIHPTNLLIGLEEEKLDYNEIAYFDQLIKDRFDNTVTYKYDENLFGEIVGQAKLWVIPQKKIQYAARIGSIAIKINMTTPKDDKYLTKMEHWNTILGLKNNKINVKHIFTDPFYVDDINFKARNVYKSGIAVYSFFAKINFIDGMEFVKTKLKAVEFENYFKKSDFN